MPRAAATAGGVRRGAGAADARGQSDAHCPAQRIGAADRHSDRCADGASNAQHRDTTPDQSAHESTNESANSAADGEPVPGQLQRACAFPCQSDRAHQRRYCQRQWLELHPQQRSELYVLRATDGNDGNIVVVGQSLLCRLTHDQFRHQIGRVGGAAN